MRGAVLGMEGVEEGYEGERLPIRGRLRSAP
jgi:hypothetical protein